jgi:hypothetical protein
MGIYMHMNRYIHFSLFKQLEENSDPDGKDDINVCVFL